MCLSGFGGGQTHGVSIFPVPIMPVIFVLTALGVDALLDTIWGLELWVASTCFLPFWPPSRLSETSGTFAGILVPSVERHVFDPHEPRELPHGDCDDSVARR